MWVCRGKLDEMSGGMTTSFQATLSRVYSGKWKRRKGKWSKGDLEVMHGDLGNGAPEEGEISRNVGS